MRLLITLLSVLTAIPAAAQIQSRPTDPPLVTAANESWYQLREPVQFAGDLYYPAGAVQFFNGNTMVRTGHYNGVPLYADTTVEPYSVVLVPVSRGLMQPYERLRRGDLAGTTGSRTPSFPVQLTPTVTYAPAAAIAPTVLPQVAGAIGVFTPEPPPATQTLAVRDNAAAGAALLPAAPTAVATVLRPENNDGVWIRFRGEKWVSDGAAVRFAPGGFTRVGMHGDFPVFARKGLRDEVIYLPTTTGLVAPYRLKG
jgi:hypothetical protein